VSIMVDYDRFDDEVLKNQNLDRVTSVEKFEQRSWDRDNIGQRVNEIQSNHDTIETILQDINEQLDGIPTKDELEDDWSGFLDRVKTDNRGRPTQLPRAFFDAERDRSELLLRQAIWQARLKELESFARRKLSDKFESLLEEYRTAQSHETLNQMLEQKAEHFATEKVDEKAVEIKEWKNMIEKMGQSLREEKRSLWSMMERVAELEGTGLTKDDVREVQEETLEEFVTSKGVFTLDSGELEKDAEESEREDVAESVAESVVEDESGSNVYSLKGKSFDEKVDVLVDLWDSENIHERIDDDNDDITKSEIADMTDVSQATLFNQGLFEKIEDEQDLFLRTP
jgi:hypothetical protein